MTAVQERTRLASDFATRRNSLGAFRLALALLVVVGHTWQLGGYGSQPQLGGVYISAWGLFGFFAISGFLITRSRTHRASLGEFVKARLLRIYPGFLVCLLVVAFVFAPISVLLPDGGSYHLRDAIGYVFTNLPLYPPFVHVSGIGDTLASTPFADNWDEPMWSLFYEAACYAVIALLVSVLPRRSLPLAVPALFVGATALTLVVQTGVVPLPYEWSIGTELLTIFLGGSTLWILAERIPVARWDVAVSAVVLALIVPTGFASVFAALPLVHLLIRASTLVPLSRIGRRWDISYGVYIYGMPLMQLTALAFPDERLPFFGFLGIVLSALLPIAFASSALVEMPAVRLKDVSLHSMLHWPARPSLDRTVPTDA